MNFTEAIKTCFAKKYANFDGVATRPEYWWFSLLMFVLVAIGRMTTPAFELILIVTCFLPGLGVSIRRLHDVNLSGWWILWSLIPYIGLAILIPMMLPSNPNSRWAKPATELPE